MRIIQNLKTHAYFLRLRLCHIAHPPQDYCVYCDPAMLFGMCKTNCDGRLQIEAPGVAQCNECDYMLQYETYKG